MTDDDVPLDLKLARQARDEAEQHRKAAEKDLAEAQYLRAQSARDRAEIAELEQAISRREQALQQAGEPEFIRREQEATDKLKQAQELMQAYSNDRHAAAIYLRQCSEREAAEQSAA